MPIDRVRHLPLWDICTESGPAPDNELLPVPGGQVVLGKSKAQTNHLQTVSDHVMIPPAGVVNVRSIL